MPETPSIEDIIEARDAIAGIAVRTPLVLSALSGCTPDDVLLKLETLQPVGSFKLRGAAFAISRLDDAQKRAGVVCFSTGNHGRAVAYAARAQGIRATICLPSLASPVKRAAIEALAADIRVPGATQDDVKNAVVYVGSEYYKINCVLKDAETGKIVCSVNEKFASEGAVLYVAGLAFFVDLPSHANPGDTPDQDVPLTCDEGMFPGADAKFQYAGWDKTWTWLHLEGATLAEVAENASQYIGAKFNSFEVVSGLYCASGR